MTRDDGLRGSQIFNRILLLGAAVGLLGIGGLASTAVASGTHRARGAPETVLTSYRSKLGWQLVVEANGQKVSLFAFSQDSAGKSACGGRCQRVWYPLLKVGKLVVATDSQHVNTKRVRTFKRKDGSFQVEYWGQPLYRCRSDIKTGQIRGADSYQFGGSWGLMGAQGSANLGSGMYGGSTHRPRC
jgi:predicted lipoprotein with Yx(FWY)xxD motif